MLVAMIVNATATIMFYISYMLNLTQTLFYANSFAISAETFVHWMFCYTYLTLSIEVKYMFDRRIFTDDPVVMQEISMFNCCLNIAHAISIVICVGMLIYGIVATTNKATNILWYLGTSLQLVFLVVWATSLCALFT